jgi:hypothetical protein
LAKILAGYFGLIENRIFLVDHQALIRGSTREKPTCRATFYARLRTVFIRWLHLALVVIDALM